VTIFDIFPAVDLRKGRVVRLQYGDPARQTVFGDDPVAMARQWVEAGSRWLHVVNLDGALNEAGTANWQVLPQITRLGAAVQFGGGLRTLADVTRVLEAGASRVILGTAAVEDPDLVAASVVKYGADRILVGIDARHGQVKTRGWQTETAVTPLKLGQQMKALGVHTVIYTDISRDGVLKGVNVETTTRLARHTGLRIIASGGVASLADVIRTRAQAKQGVVGVIIGRALYDGRIDLPQALELTQV